MIKESNAFREGTRMEDDTRIELRVASAFNDFFEALASPKIEVEDQDSIEVCGYTLLVHKDGLAGQVKATVKLSHERWRQLLKDMVSDGVDIEDWSCVDLSWVVEG